jgi:hypothetical protein
MISLKSIQEAIEKEINPTRIFFDLSKPCDVLNHNILPSKLDVYGIKKCSKCMVSIISIKSENICLSKLYSNYHVDFRKIYF